MENSIGTSTTNTLTGTSGSNLLNGKAGDDYIDGGGGSDIILAGAGNDVIVSDEIDKKIDGGTGYDTLLFLGTNQSLNLTTNKTIANVEQLWLQGGGGHQIWLTAADIIRVSDIDRLVITGDHTDHISLGDLSGWTFPTTVNPDGKVTFTNGSASFIVTPGVHIDGYSQTAVISVTSPASLEVREDTSASLDNYLTLQITVQINDPNPGEAVLNVTDDMSNLGTLTLLNTSSITGGSVYQYSYKVANNLAAIQALNTADSPLTEHFQLTSPDGATETLSIHIYGLDENHAPTLGACTATTIAINQVPVTEEILANTITRTGTITVTDADLDDTISATLVSGSHLSLSDPVQSSTSPNTWLINWTYAINDDNMERVVPDSGSISEDIQISIADNHGASVMLNMTATIYDYVDTELFALKTVGTIGNDTVTVGANQWYFGDSGDDMMTGSSTTSLIVGGTGDDILAGTGTLFGDEGYDQFYLDDGPADGKAYGGDQSDTFYLTGTDNYQAFGNADDDYFLLGSGNTDLWMYGGSGQDIYYVGKFESNPTTWVLDFDFGTNYLTGDKIDFAQYVIHADVSMFALELVTLNPNAPAPGMSIPPGVNSYYELWFNQNPADSDSPNLHLMNIVASNLSTAYVAADIFDNMLFHNNHA